MILEATSANFGKFFFCSECDERWDGIVNLVTQHECQRGTGLVGPRELLLEIAAAQVEVQRDRRERVAQAFDETQRRTLRAIAGRRPGGAKKHP